MDTTFLKNDTGANLAASEMVGENPTINVLSDIPRQLAIRAQDQLSRMYLPDTFDKDGKPIAKEVSISREDVGILIQAAEAWYATNISEVNQRVVKCPLFHEAMVLSIAPAILLQCRSLVNS